MMFFDVIARPRTWRSIGYLLLAFPLGIFYFVFLVTGLSLGFGLFITLLGIPVLVGVLATSYGLGEFERVTTNLLLETDIEPARRLDVAGGLWPKVKALVGSSEVWKRIVYLFSEFPFGIVSFVMVTVTASMFALVISPFVYERSWWFEGTEWFGNLWVIDTLGESIIVAVLGVLVGFALLHVLNGMARVWGEFAKLMLGPGYRAPAAEQQPRPLQETHR